MNALTTSPNTVELTNGSGAAAVLAAGIGAFTIAVIDIAADEVASIKSMTNFYRPTGPLSGVTTISILVWLACWAILDWQWRKKNVGMARIGTVALVLLVLSLLLTFPPIAEIF
jgi:hypothetical protein